MCVKMAGPCRRCGWCWSFATGGPSVTPSSAAGCCQVGCTFTSLHHARTRILCCRTSISFTLYASAGIWCTCADFVLVLLMHNQVATHHATVCPV